MYLGETPIAVLTNGGVYQVYADHIGAPRVIADSANGSIIWRWDMADPFGTALPNEDPSNLGASFVYNLRFPGQLFDKESGLHYNYYRDYDPQTGRYIESDPIGLDGGINTYAYVGANPGSYVDPRGLQFFPLPAPVPPPVAPSLSLNPPSPGGGIKDIFKPDPRLPTWTLPDWLWDKINGPMESRASGEEKLPIVNPGRDCDGNCKPCPPGKKWFVPKPGHGHDNGYWHTIVYNQDKKTCTCYPDRPSGGLEGF